MAKTALVTGASSGIGAAIAIKLANEFDVIAINSRTNSKGLSEVAAKIEEAGKTCLIYKGDIGNYNFAGNMIKEIADKYGSISLIVNNAGISSIGLLCDTTKEMWDEVISSNLTSVYNTCHHAYGPMVKNKQGHIINISSMWGNLGASCEVAYSATKGGINAFTKALAKELAPSHIRVNAIACGVIDTKMNSHLSDEEKDFLISEIPADRMGTPEEVADLVLNIYNSPAYLTGAIIPLDGGF